MRSRKVLIALISLISFQGQAESVWSKLIETDLNHIYSTVKENHPGYVDSENIYFKKWFEQGYEQALIETKKAQTLNHAMTILKTFVAGFADGHFYLNLNYQPKKIKWAGIKVNKYGKDYRVSYVDSKNHKSMPRVMSKLLSCDNKAVADIMLEDVLKYRFNDKRVNSPKVRFAPKILIDDGIGNRVHYASCKFDYQGEVKDIKLSWENISHNKYLNKVTFKNTLTAKNFNFEQFDNDKYWVSLPKFYPNKQEQKVLRDVIKKVKNVRRSASKFIIDVRGNGGGNSQWGVEVAKAIYGDVFIETHQLLNPDSSYALWRVSNDNIQHLQGVLPWIEEQFTKESSMFTDFSKLLNDMKRAKDQGKVFVKQGSNSDGIIKENHNNTEMKTHAKVLFLTDSSCGSACLDFADLLLRLPNVSHIGQETGADTVYMDIRNVKLPSGLGQYSIAQKVYRNRPRKHNESYAPKYYFNDDISNTEKLKTWINKLEIK